MSLNLTSRRLLFWGVAAFVVAIILWRLFAAKNSREIRLNDGRTLVIQKVSYGTKHELVYGKPWYRMAAAIAPAKWKQKLPLRFFRLASSGSAPSLVIWGEWKLNDSNGPPRWLTISDSQWRPAARVYGNPYYIASNRLVMGWVVENFPRRLPSLSFELTDWVSRTWKPLTNFTVANPVPRKFPSWKAESFPAVYRTNSIDFVLANVAPGPFVSDPSIIFPRSELTPGFEGIFQVLENGQPRLNWGIFRMTVRDSTGNRVSSGLASTSRAIGDFLVMGIDGPLWSTEPAWKVTGDFARISDFATNEVCTVKGIPVPPSGTTTQILATAQLNGVTIIGVELSWRGPRFAPAPPVQSLEIEPLLASQEKEDFVSLVEARDEEGRSLAFENLYNALEPFHFAIKAPGAARSLDLTFAIHRRVTAEWTVGLARAVK